MSKHIESSTIIPCPLPTHKNFRNLVGEKFGRLNVVRFAGKRINSLGYPVWFWECKCDCGNMVFARGTSIACGESKSCGCFQRDDASRVHTIHGLSNSPEYKTWTAIRDRCFNPNTEFWRYYGGRGVKVCDRWMDFENFFADMGVRPSSKHSIERRNTNGDYEPSNCCWATWVDQSRNRRSNRIITFNGQQKCLAEWSEITGIKTDTIASRIRNGWSPELALTRPAQKRSKPVHRGARAQRLGSTSVS